MLTHGLLGLLLIQVVTSNVEIASRVFGLVDRWLLIVARWLDTMSLALMHGMVVGAQSERVSAPGHATIVSQLLLQFFKLRLGVLRIEL